MTPRTTRRCPYCNAMIDPSATFCDQCGNTLLAIGSTQLLPTPQPPTRRSSPLLWVITVVVIGVLLGLGGVLWSQASRLSSTVVVIATPSGSSVVPATAARITSACLVPNVIGQDQGAAEGLIIGAGLQPVKSTTYDPNIPVGGVISQDPPSGTERNPCQGKVTIVVSLGSIPRSPTITPIPPTATPISMTGRWISGREWVYISQTEGNHLTIEIIGRGPFSGQLRDDNTLIVNFYDDPGCCTGQFIREDGRMIINWSNGGQWIKNQP